MLNKKNESIKVIPLGGVGEIGKNMYVVEVDEEIFVLDAGLMFPENEMLGIDTVIPDISYLEDNKDRVKGIFLTHGHDDAIGALPYVLRKINTPIYGTKLTIALAKDMIKGDKLQKENIFHTIDSETILEFDSATVSFFKTTHSIPDSVGISVGTSEGKIVYTGDFKFDQAALEHYQSEIGKIAKIGEEGVLCLLSDSTEAERPGYSVSDAVISEQIKDSFHATEGRIVVACYASNLIKIQQVLNAAFDNNRKVAVLGKDIERVYDIALKLGYLDVKDENMLIPIQEIDKYPAKNLVIIATGNMGEPIQMLQKMAKQSHRQVNIRKGDTVFITSTPSPALETYLAKTVDLLYRAGATMMRNKKNIYVSGHGSQEDLKLMINLLKPAHFVPIQGEYRMLFAHAKLAQTVGLTKKSIFIPGKGEIIEYKKGKMSTGNRVSAGNVLIDGLGVGDVGNIVLRDRKLLSEDGIFIIVVTLNRRQRKIATGPEIISRGFVYVRESEKLIAESSKLIANIVEKNLSQERFEWASIKQDIRDQLNRFLFERTKRRPMILPIIMEV